MWTLNRLNYLLHEGSYYIRFEIPLRVKILTVFRLRCHVFLGGYHHFGGICLYSENGGSMFLWGNGNHLLGYMVSQPRRLPSAWLLSFVFKFRRIKSNVMYQVQFVVKPVFHLYIFFLISVDNFKNLVISLYFIVGGVVMSSCRTLHF
jgi:hypothetical protein